jgi:hypothetical protein
MKKLKQKKIDHLKGSCKKMQADKRNENGRRTFITH